MKFKLIWICSLFFGALICVHAQNPKPIAGDAPFIEDFRSSFRYIVTADVTDVQKRVNDTPNNRYLEVLIEDKDFNEKNLAKLFMLLGGRYPDRPGLFVYVFTSMDAIRTPEEYDRVPYWGPRPNYRQQYKYAYYSRDEYGERFEYRIPGVLDHKEIRIKPAGISTKSFK